MRLAAIVAALIMLSASLVVEAQRDGKLYRIGILGVNASDPVQVPPART